LISYQEASVPDTRCGYLISSYYSFMTQIARHVVSCVTVEIW